MEVGSLQSETGSEVVALYGKTDADVGKEMEVGALQRKSESKVETFQNKTELEVGALQKRTET